jgi:hypothetical protein
MESLIVCRPTFIVTIAGRASARRAVRAVRRGSASAAATATVWSRWRLSSPLLEDRHRNCQPPFPQAGRLRRSDELAQVVSS